MVPLGCRKWSPPLPRPSVSFTLISNNAKENGPLRRYTGECALRYLRSPDLRLGTKKEAAMCCTPPPHQSNPPHWYSVPVRRPTYLALASSHQQRGPDKWGVARVMCRNRGPIQLFDPVCGSSDAGGYTEGSRPIGVQHSRATLINQHDEVADGDRGDASFMDHPP